MTEKKRLKDEADQVLAEETKKLQTESQFALEINSKTLASEIVLHET